MPKVIKSSKYAAVVECPYVPPTENIEVAQRFESTVCARCGIHVDSVLRNKELWTQTGGQYQFKLMCMNPTSPYLAVLKKQLLEEKKKG